MVGWQVLYLTMLGRQAPDLPCTALFDAAEWQALACYMTKTAQPPATPPNLGQVMRWLAQLGGFQGRTSDGDPGSTVLWRGLQRLVDITAAWHIFRPVTFT